MHIFTQISIFISVKLFKFIFIIAKLPCAYVCSIGREMNGLFVRWAFINKFLGMLCLQFCEAVENCLLLIDRKFSLPIEAFLFIEFRLEQWTDRFQILSSLQMPLVKRCVYFILSFWIENVHLKASIVKFCATIIYNRLLSTRIICFDHQVRCLLLYLLSKASKFCLNK